MCDNSENIPPNPRIKLTACGTVARGRMRWRSHAAAYPHSWVDLSLMAFDEARERQTIKVTEPE